MFDWRVKLLEYKTLRRFEFPGKILTTFSSRVFFLNGDGISQCNEMQYIERNEGVRARVFFFFVISSTILLLKMVNGYASYIQILVVINFGIFIKVLSVSYRHPLKLEFSKN